MDSADYCCPRCKGTLSSLPDAYACAPCNVRYPVVLGIPDFRVFPDPYIGMVEDHRKGARIAERASKTDFRGLVEYYWSITPEEPAEMARRFTAQALAAAERGRHLLDGQARVKTQLERPARRVLDVGTRTGGLLLAAAERADQVVGIDIAFRWLIIARKRLEEAGLPAQLVCCCAEFLPFRESAFDLVLAENVLEHTAQPAAVHRRSAPCAEAQRNFLRHHLESAGCRAGTARAVVGCRLAAAWTCETLRQIAQRRKLRSRPAALGLPVGAHGPAHCVSAVRDRVADISARRSWRMFHRRSG